MLRFSARFSRSADRSNPQGQRDLVVEKRMSPHGPHRVTSGITAKKANPDWTAPAEMIARQRDVPRPMKGGDPANPLGTHAMYPGSTALPDSRFSRCGLGQ
jgi:lipoprotein-anchoring transpeptidase ErfK/SrfK